MPISTQIKLRSLDELIPYVLRSPIRVDALAICTEGEASVVEIARMIGEEEKKVSAHVNSLLACGCIERVRSEKRRGADVHFYRTALRPNIGAEEWAALPPGKRQEISALAFQVLVAEALAAFRTRRFDARLTRHLSWRTMRLDEPGWNELNAELSESQKRIEKIAARSEERLAEAGDAGFPAVAAAMSFERALPQRSRREAARLMAAIAQ